ncbi:uncharacterized protein PHALS_09316 [Plasmopara halstedii]|uniref:Uncharacterized protein n=1 Tax=Plasmopara halstedii TaxID=4781 RepID=A0A0P1AFD2_PLAHL|nr:uncharacterized protein PHALS_09316 [Plasmopara halstedii]CEG39264.1 hypothetical protein PHALS_09316 [Plasmopara halstedii]|eukprot:XP_024575633.1 hypothetical protein PHALS_09316 [Plasmopara halstedii]
MWQRFVGCFTRAQSSDSLRAENGVLEINSNAISSKLGRRKHHDRDTKSITLMKGTKFLYHCGF